MSKQYLIYRSFLLIGILMSVFLISCDKDEEPKPIVQDEPANESISKKWEVNNTASNGKLAAEASDFLWFEFTVEGYYIIRKSDLSNLVGTYTMSGTTITLNGLGTLEISDVSDNAFTFAFFATGENQGVRIFTNVAQELVAESTKSDLICKTWSIKRQHGKYLGQPLDQSYPNAVISEFTAVFSSYGTYLIVMEYSTGAKQIFNRLWRWKDSEETMICAGDISSECTGDNETTVVELTEKSFKLRTINSAIGHDITDELVEYTK